MFVGTWRSRVMKCPKPPVIPRHSMYGIFTYIGVVLEVNVGIYGSPMECLGNDRPSNSPRVSCESPIAWTG